ncbi:MAG: histidine kinase [Eubacteriales bacterium]|nr:histidine kinase [Eubacteriales bacterium]
MKKQISYHYRLYLEVAFMILILVVFLGAFFYRYNSNILKESVEKNTLEALTTIHTRIDDRLKELDNVAKKIQASQDFLDLAAAIPEGEENYFQKYPSKKTEVNGLILSSLVSEELGTNIHFVTRYLDSIGVYMRVDPYDRVQVTKEKIRSFRAIMEGLEMEEYVRYLPPHENEWTVGEELVFSILRPVRNNFETFGVLEVSQGMRELEELLELQEFSDSYAILLMDGQEEHVYSYGTEEGTDIEKILAKGMSGQAYEYIGNQTLVCSHQSPLTGWTLIMARDLSDWHRQMDAFRTMLLGVLAALFCVMMVFLYLLTKSLTKPLRELKDKLYKLQLDEEIHLDIRAESNEVTALTVGIEDILNQIRNQNRLMIEIRKRAVKAHLDQMEAQMNPHFLYNALAVIGACGQEDGSERVYEMSRGLAGLLRYAVKYDHNLVEFQDEIQNARNYLLIMGLRYENQVEVAWELDASLDHVKVPKLSFQPMLENCFKHAFRSRTEKWRIIVRSRRVGEQWRFQVKNNGEPFEEEQIAKIRERYDRFARNVLNPEGSQEQTEPAGLGLENTLKRLAIQYGDAAFWDIRICDGWTIVEIGGEILGSEVKDSACGG